MVSVFASPRDDADASESKYWVSGQTRQQQRQRGQDMPGAGTALHAPPALLTKLFFVRGCVWLNDVCDILVVSICCVGTFSTVQCIAQTVVGSFVRALELYPETQQGLFLGAANFFIFQTVQTT